MNVYCHGETVFARNTEPVVLSGSPLRVRYLMHGQGEGRLGLVTAVHIGKMYYIGSVYVANGDTLEVTIAYPTDGAGVVREADIERIAAEVDGVLA